MHFLMIFLTITLLSSIQLTVKCYTLDLIQDDNQTIIENNNASQSSTLSANLTSLNDTLAKHVDNKSLDAIEQHNHSNISLFSIQHNNQTEINHNNAKQINLTLFGDTTVEHLNKSSFVSEQQQKNHNETPLSNVTSFDSTQTVRAKEPFVANQHQVVGEQYNVSSKICLTPGCVKAAAEILKNIDSQVNPCDDFYKYTCGKWIDSQVIPDDKSSVSRLSTVQDVLDRQLRNLIEQPPIGNESSIVVMMRDLYDSCMNTTRIEELGNDPLLKSINQLGGWPVLGQKSGWSPDKQFDWLDLLIQFRRRGFQHNILIDLSVAADFKNNTRHIITLDQASLALLDRSYLYKGLNDSAVAAYYNLMVASAINLGADKREAEAQMLDVLKFETFLARITIAFDQAKNISKMYNKIKLSKLTPLFKNINWEKYLVNMLDMPLSGDEEIVGYVPGYFHRLDRLLKEADKKTLQNYMMWRIVLQSMPLLGKTWRPLMLNYRAVTSGQQRELPRWETCLSALTGTLSIAMSSMYVKSNFKSDSKGLATEMVESIKKEFVNILDEVAWMDDTTRQEAKAKAEAISSYIGYPDELLNDTLIEQLYSGLNLTEGNFFENVLRVRKWAIDSSFRKLRKPNLKVSWWKHADVATANAYYNSLDNSIEIPAGILQDAFFDRERPNYLNFGAIGWVIGHEITHGFDDRGRQFDKDGNNLNWWNVKTDQRFKEQAQCIVDQYSNYTEPINKIKLDGSYTEGENVADNGGLKAAFRAYNQWVKLNGPEPLLPGISMSPRELFWVSAANVWCSKYRPEIQKMRVRIGSHSPEQFRITGPFSNLKEFSETFNCSLGAPLNPAKKCSVW